MYYQKIFNNTNVEVATYSPRESGETEARSDWKEKSLQDLPEGHTRLSYIRHLSDTNKRVWLKTATKGGRARVFVNNA